MVWERVVGWFKRELAGVTQLPEVALARSIELDHALTDIRAGEEYLGRPRIATLDEYLRGDAALSEAENDLDVNPHPLGTVLQKKTVLNRRVHGAFLLRMRAGLALLLWRLTRGGWDAEWPITGAGPWGVWRGEGSG